MSTRTTARPVAAALVVMLGLLAGPFVGSAQAATVSGGHLDWGVKQSFRTYIGGPIAHGTITGFAGFYEAGTELDAVTVAIALDGATLPPGSASTSTTTPTTPAAALADTGSPVVPLVALGALLLVSGAGLLRARRVA